MIGQLLRASAVVSALALAGCATMPGAPGGACAAAPATGVPSPQAIANAQRLAGAPGSAPPPAAAPAPSALRTFADIVRDAKDLPGLFPLWQKDDKVWIEIAPDQFDRPYFFSTNLDQGLGESRFLAGSMSSSLSQRFGGPAIVVFRKVGGNVQLVARNVKYTAQPGHAGSARRGRGASPTACSPPRAIVSQPHPERKSVLIEANALFFGDLPGAAPRLEQAYRQSYAFDARNSSFREVRSTADFASFNVTAHYALARVTTSRTRPAGSTPSRRPRCPTSAACSWASTIRSRSCPTRRCVRASRGRRASATSAPTCWDFTTDDRRIPIVHYINRWRLEKKDPAAALSEPKQPIVFWIDRTVPGKYRATIRDGVLEWNKAFERIGYKDAIQVEIQPDDAELQHVRHPPRVDPLDDDGAQRASPPSARRRRSALRRDPRRRHRHRRDAASARSRASARRASRARAVGASVAFADAPYCTYAAEAIEHEAFAHVAARGARRDDARRTGGRGVHPVEAQGDDHARGRPHARAHAQLPRVDRRTREAQLADREFTTQERPRGLGHGVQRRQHRAQGRAAGRVPHVHARARTTTGPSSTATGARAGARKPPSSRASRSAQQRAARSRSWPTTRCTTAASIRA